VNRARRTRRIAYLVYLLLLVAGAFALYKLVPAGVIDAVRTAYLGQEPENP